MLDNIVTSINESLKAGPFKDDRFDGSRFCGLTDQVSKELEDDKRETYPIEINADGEGTPIYIDDVNCLTIYHKLLSTIVGTPQKARYGRGEYIDLTRTMSAVVIANRERLKVSQDDLNLFLIGGMPKSISAELKTKLALKSCNINVLSSDLDAPKIFAREYPTIGKPYSPELMLIEFRYSIGCTFDTRCINYCCE